MSEAKFWTQGMHQWTGKTKDKSLAVMKQAPGKNQLNQ